MENTFVYNSEGTMNLKALIKQQFIHKVSLMIQSMGCYDTQWGDTIYNDRFCI